MCKFGASSERMAVLSRLRCEMEMHVNSTPMHFIDAVHSHSLSRNDCIIAVPDATLGLSQEPPL